MPAETEPIVPPMDRKAALRDDLAGLSPSGDAETDKWIADALKNLDESLDPSRWMDASHLDPILGNEVFDAEKKAAKPLQQILGGGAPTGVKNAVADIINGLLDVDSTLAQTAIDSVEAACASVECPKELTKAGEKMAEAAAERAMGHAEKAIGHYKEAWEQAQKALVKLAASKGDTRSGDKRDLPNTLQLSQNYPNPFNPSTQISFSLPASSAVHLSVFDVTGKEVARLVDGFMEKGVHAVRWEARDLPSGIYLYRLEAGRFVQMRKMLLLR